MTARSMSAPRASFPDLARLLALVAAVALVGGCALSRPAPVKQVFLLEAAVPAPAAKPQPGTLRVGTVGVAAPYRGKALVFRQSELGYDADFYTEFLVIPSAMIGDATARALDGARVFARVIPPGAPPDGDWVLDGFVGALYGDRRDPAKPAAELAITWYLSRADAATSTPFWSKEYRRRVPVSGTTADAHATALSAALGEIAADLARDLAAVPLPSR
jgi:ABC-type uncharacterized transport system auxiliary subunit